MATGDDSAGSFIHRREISLSAPLLNFSHLARFLKEEAGNHAWLMHGFEITRLVQEDGAEGADEACGCSPAHHRVCLFEQSRE